MTFRSQMFAGDFNSFRRRNHRDPYGSDDVDLISDHFSYLSLSLPKPRPVLSLPLSLQSLRPHGDESNQRLYGQKTYFDPFYELHLSNLCKKQTYQEMVLQRQEKAMFYKGGFVHRNGSVLKESVGTGVFHPLHHSHQSRTTHKSSTFKKRRHHRNQNKCEKELLNEERTKVIVTRQQQQEECHYHLPPDLDFSNDSTY
ncbi:unnamed protein product [Cochlearia groenlandica]